MRWRHRVTSAEAGERLDRLLARRLAEADPGLTRSRIKKLMDEGRVTVDGTAVKAGHPVRAGERVEIEVPPPPAVVPEPEDIPLEVVFEDESMLVVDKPAGLVVHPGAGRSRGTLVNALLGRGTPLSTVGAPFRPGIVHRLDKGTSGLLVVAKTDAAHRRLSAALAAREVSRRYWALVWGAPGAETGRITGSLARSRADRRRMRVVGTGGRAAATRYRVGWSGNGVSVLTLALETGRTHQIRAHLKHQGWPVFGDPEYGGRSVRGFSPSEAERSRIREALRVLDRQALHAALLAFRHPVTGARLEFASRLAEDICRAAGLLGVPPGAMTVGSKEEV